MAESLLAFTQSLSSNPFVLISENECSSADGVITLSNKLFVAFISIYSNRNEACTGAAAIGANASITIQVVSIRYPGSIGGDSVLVKTTSNTILVSGANRSDFNYIAICFA